VSDADESSRFDFAVVKYRPLLGTDEDEDEDEWVSSGRPSPRGAAGASSSSATALVPARPSTDVLLARLRSAALGCVARAQIGRGVAVGAAGAGEAGRRELRAAYAVIVEKKRLVVISGPAGSGKSELLKLFMAVVGKEKARVVAPTQGAQRVLPLKRSVD